MAWLAYQVRMQIFTHTTSFDIASGSLNPPPNIILQTSNLSEWLRAISFMTNLNKNKSKQTAFYVDTLKIKTEVKRNNHIDSDYLTGYYVDHGAFYKTYVYVCSS